MSNSSSFDASLQRRETPNFWQQTVDGSANFRDRAAAYALTDRKLVGERRTEVRKWIYTCGTRRRLAGLMARLESMPDL